MITATGAQYFQKARSICARVDEVAQDVAAEQQRSAPRLLQFCLDDCDALAKQWRATTGYYVDAMNERDQDFDYRNLRDVLLPAAEKTRVVYCDVEKMIQQSPGTIQDHSDLTAAMTQIEKLIPWLESWPSNDTTWHKLARESIARGEFVSDEELASGTWMSQDV